MTEPSTLHIRQADLQDAERQGLLPADGAAPLWHWLAQRTAPAPGPRFDTTHILYYLGGLTEATETLACFVAMCLWPQHFALWAWGFAALCAVTLATRVVGGAAILGRRR